MAFRLSALFACAVDTAEYSEGMTTTTTNATHECPRCGGSGSLPFAMASGVCFLCCGRGTLSAAQVAEHERRSAAQVARVDASLAAAMAADAVMASSPLGPHLPWSATLYSVRQGRIAFIEAATLAALREGLRAAIRQTREAWTASVWYGTSPRAVEAGYVDDEAVATWGSDGTGAHEVADKLRAVAVAA